MFGLRYKNNGKVSKGPWDLPDFRLMHVLCIHIRSISGFKNLSTLLCIMRLMRCPFTSDHFPRLSMC